MAEYHLQHFDACPPHWPNGGWSVYKITGDQIAERTVWAAVKQAENGVYYVGPVLARHAWCGYLGIVEMLAEVPGLIEMCGKD